MSPWVVDPGVNRSGLLYDLVSFTRRVSQLRDAPPERQESAFRAFFHLQRRLDQIAQEHRLYHEKYLGDGSFYTGRDCVRLLVAALRMQRAYRDALRRGFPFDDGMRIALNHGHYRLLPLGGPYASGTRYEIFGESVVELFRLVSGKSSQDLDEVASSLVARGYGAEEVRKFFAPLVGPGTAGGEATPFRARLSRAGQLLNNGIVATEAFLQDLEESGSWRSLRRFVGGDRRFLVIELEDAGECLDVGLRPLGLADLKGLPSPLLYEVLDTDLLGDGVLERLAAPTLKDAFRALADEPAAKAV
jgi:class 3 adenylate cyclase